MVWAVVERHDTTRPQRWGRPKGGPRPENRRPSSRPTACELSVSQPVCRPGVGRPGVGRIQDKEYHSAKIMPLTPRWSPAFRLRRHAKAWTPTTRRIPEIVGQAIACRNTAETGHSAAASFRYNAEIDRFLDAHESSTTSDSGAVSVISSANSTRASEFADWTVAGTSTSPKRTVTESSRPPSTATARLFSRS